VGLRRSGKCPSRYYFERKRDFPKHWSQVRLSASGNGISSRDEFTEGAIGETGQFVFQ
jgi:hypothetical protein